MNGKTDFQIITATHEHVDTLVAFNQGLASETEDKHLDEGVLRRGVRSVLDNEDRGFYLVAVDSAGEAAGSLMITYEWSDWRDGWFWWIQSVYVRTSARRQGVYAQLYQDVLTRAEQAGDVRGIRLYVEHENVAAQKTYERLGMEACRYRMYEAML